jgi:FAD/FMN-containing dehydrogenase/Fe-S oxidoreductase
VPLVPRGAGTGLAGEALGTGLIVDLSRHFRDILEVTSDTVRVQPGVTYQALNARLAQEGRRFAPDPASGRVCTVGGMLANNASGSHALRHGYTRDHVASLRIVLDTGAAVQAGQEPVQPSAVPVGHLHDIVTALAVLLEQNAGLVRACQPRTPFNRLGYLLHDVLRDSMVDLPKVLVGSEGTLALFTEATLKTLPLPGGRSLVLLGFASLESAWRAVQRTLPTGPAACELLDRRLLSLAREGNVNGVAALVPPAAEAVVLVEYESEGPSAARAAARDLVDLLRGDRQVLHVVSAFEPADLERLWHLRDVALPSLFGLKRGAQPVPFVEDVAVPLEEMPEYLRRVQEVLQEHETTASFLMHAGAGQVHTRPFLDLGSAEDISKLSALSEKIHTLALSLGGTVSTQHGTGLARTAWVPRQYGPLYPVLRQVKAIFDPHGIFNPGKIVDPLASPWPLRRQAQTNSTSWLLRWEPGQVAAESNQCNGCGHCRLEAPAQRMCPIFRASHTEGASPRAKANLLRHLLQDTPDARPLAADAVRGIADLCVHCKMCAVECPARVNIPKLMLEAKAANITEHGLDRTAWFQARIEPFVRWGSALALLANPILRSRSGRWLLEKLFGLARERRLPRFSLRNFMKRARRRGWTRRRDETGPRVAYFVDIFATYHDPLLAEAVVAVLQHNGVDVYVPPGQVGCGMAALAQGDVDAAREAALRNLRALAEVAREGLPIICSEPTAALMLRQDYLDLLDDSDARLVSECTVEFTRFLWELHQQGKLRTDFHALDLCVGHHVPCHIKALGAPPAGPALLGLIPAMQVHTLDVSCSGMAGTFGLMAKNYQMSLRAGQPMLTELARPAIRYGSSECSACRMQMQQTGKRTLHPAQFLALAYGLLPALKQQLVDSPGERVTR